MTKLFKKYLQLVYMLWARIYDRYIDPQYLFNRQKVISDLQIKKNDKILELGVGTGLNLPYYPSNCIVTGIDFSNAMLLEARKKNSRAEVILQKADARSLPFPDNYFHKAVATYVIRVSPEPKRILQETARVIKKDGMLCIVDKFREEQSIRSGLKLLLLGGGRDYLLFNLLKNTSWKMYKYSKIGMWKNSRIILLKNRK